jgi:hypothetical protein
MPDWSIEIIPDTEPGGHAAFVLDLKEHGDALAANPGESSWRFGR